MSVFFNLNLLLLTFFGSVSRILVLDIDVIFGNLLEEPIGFLLFPLELGSQCFVHELESSPDFLILFQVFNDLNLIFEVIQGLLSEIFLIVFV